METHYWENGIDIQHKNGDLVVLNAYKRNRMKRKKSRAHENEINNIERETLDGLKYKNRVNLKAC